MAPKKISKTRYLDINTKEGGFVTKLTGGAKKHNFADIALLRKLLTNQKARILHTLKTKKPESIYALAKLLKRDFKSVRDDVKLLERFGFLEFHTNTKGKRESLKPVLTVTEMQIILSI